MLQTAYLVFWSPDWSLGLLFHRSLWTQSSWTFLKNSKRSTATCSHGCPGTSFRSYGSCWGFSSLDSHIAHFVTQTLTYCDIPNQYIMFSWKNLSTFQCPCVHHEFVRGLWISRYVGWLPRKTTVLINNKLIMNWSKQFYFICRWGFLWPPWHDCFVYWLQVFILRQRSTKRFECGLCYCDYCKDFHASRTGPCSFWWLTDTAQKRSYRQRFDPSVDYGWRIRLDIH